MLQFHGRRRPTASPASGPARAPVDEGDRGLRRGRSRPRARAIWRSPTGCCSTPRPRRTRGIPAATGWRSTGRFSRALTCRSPSCCQGGSTPERRRGPEASPALRASTCPPGVESSPGEKDPDRIAAFVGRRQDRSAEQARDRGKPTRTGSTAPAGARMTSVTHPRPRTPSARDPTRPAISACLAAASSPRP